MEELKKKRGRPKKILTEDTSVVVEKKKRGRPRKFNPYREFSENIQSLFNTYINDYNNIINLILSYKNKDIRISQNDWNIIYNHVKDITEKLYDEDNVFHKLNTEYHYKPNSSWRNIDYLREQNRIYFINDFLNNPEDKDEILYNGYMIYSHMKLYIVESSKENKI